MTQTWTLVSVLISSVIVVGVAFITLILKFLHRDISQLRAFSMNHFTDVTKSIGRIEGKLGIKNEDKS